MKTLFDTFENWLLELVTRAQSGLLERIEKLEQERNDEQVSEYRIKELIQNHLCNVDWNDMIGTEVHGIVESSIENNESVRTEIRNLVDEQLDGELDDLEITVRRG